MAIRCVIIDDEPLAIELIESHLTHFEYMEVLRTFKNVLHAMEFIKNNPVDLIFLDIQMPMLSGIDFLKSAKVAPKVILTTAYREYAVESYELNVVDYLLKPITFDRFFKAIDKYFELTSTQPSPPLINHERGLEKNFIFVKADKKHVKLNFGNILYVESIKDYIKIVTSESTVIVKEKISEIATNLPEQHFIRVHRSYIVNIQKITAFTNHDIEINKIEIPIGGMYKQQVLKMLILKSDK